MENESVRDKIQLCKELLCRRKFEDCINISSKLIPEVKEHQEDCFNKAAEVLALLQIQSLTELGLVTKVNSVLKSLFGKWQDCPEKPAVACVAAHASDGNISAALELAGSWLKANWTLPSAQQIAMIFQRWMSKDPKSTEDLDVWLKNMPCCLEEDRESLLEFASTYIHELDDSELSKQDNGAAAQPNSPTPDTDSAVKSNSGLLDQLVSRLLQLLNTLRLYLWRNRHLLLGSFLSLTIFMQYAVINELTLLDVGVNLQSFWAEAWKLTFGPVKQIKH